MVFDKVKDMTVSNASGQHTLRERNVALVAQEVFTAPEPISRAAIAQRTGLTRATVSSLVDLLVDSQVVAELPPTFSKKAGRPAVPLVPATGTFFGIGLEVNVHYIGGVIVDLTGKEFARVIEDGDFQHANPAEVFTKLARIATELVESATASAHIPGRSKPILAGVNLALPGLIEPNTKTLRVAPNLGWNDLDPVDLTPIEDALRTLAGRDVPIQIGNEANFGAHAQVTLGALSTFIYVSAEVGIGSAIVLDKDVFLGRRGWSGELGHVTVDPSGPPCSCGSRGCLEQYAGLLAILRNAGLNDDSPVSALVSRLEDGDPAAMAAADTAARALGRALADYINLVDIHMIVLGGIYQKLHSYLTPVIVETLSANVVSAPWAQFDVLPSTVDGYSSLLGAATTVTREVHLSPAAWLVDSEDA